MPAGLVSQHQLASYATPINGDDLDATVVLGNDNATVVGYDAHDADGTIHLQSSALASRDPAGTAGRKWMSVDSSVVRLFYDNGSSWLEFNTIGTPLTITSTTTPQLQVGYDASNHLQVTVSSTGAVTLNATGSGAAFTISDAVSMSSTLVVASNISSTSGSLTVTATGAVSWNGRSIVRSGADGVVTLLNNAESAFTQLNFGGTTSSFPGLKRSSAALIARLADDSANAAFTCAALTVTSVTATGQLLVTLTTEQARLRYDTSNYLAMTVDSGGQQYYNVVGTGTTGHTFQIAGFGHLGISATAVTLASNGSTIKLQTEASSTTRAGLNLPHGAAPTSPVDGDVWTTSAGMYVRISGVTVGPLS